MRVACIATTFMIHDTSPQEPHTMMSDHQQCFWAPRCTLGGMIRDRMGSEQNAQGSEQNRRDRTIVILRVLCPSVEFNVIVAKS